MSSGFILVVTVRQNSLPRSGSVVSPHVDRPCFVYPFPHWWTSQGTDVTSPAGNTGVSPSLVSLGTPPDVGLLGHVGGWQLLMSGCVSPPRRLQEEGEQFRTSSLPAIPNPFPELCGPGSPPLLTRGSLPPSQAAAKQVSVRSRVRVAGHWAAG